MRAGTISGSATGANSTSQTPSGKDSMRVRAVSTASLVFPTPPVPVSVTNRRSSKSARSASIFRSRPRKDVNAIGRLCHTTDGRAVARLAVSSATGSAIRPYSSAVSVIGSTSNSTRNLLEKSR